MSAPSEIPDDENEDEEYPPDKMRTPEEVAARCVVLLGVIAAGYEQPRADIIAWLREQNLWSAVSPDEAAFLQSERQPSNKFSTRLGAQKRFTPCYGRSTGCPFCARRPNAATST